MAGRADHEARAVPGMPVASAVTAKVGTSQAQAGRRHPNGPHSRLSSCMGSGVPCPRVTYQRLRPADRNRVAVSGHPQRIVRRHPRESLASGRQR